MRTALAVLLLTWTTLAAQAGEFVVSPEGTAAGDGTAEKPWSFSAALLAVESVRPGDVVVVKSGTYGGGIVCRLKGSKEKPIVVKAQGHVTLDLRPRDERDSGNLEIAAESSDVEFRGFEVTCSNLKRKTDIPGPWPEDVRGGTVNCRGSRIKFINMVVHDTVQGFSMWAEGEGGEIYGCLIYNNGCQGPDRGHGHGIYSQNKTGTKRFADNVIFNQFSHGIHVYGTSRASLVGYDLVGNIAFNNGALSTSGEAPDILVGGGSPAERIRVLQNMTYRSKEGTSVRLGHGAANKNAEVRGNFFGGFVDVTEWATMTFTDNEIIAGGTLVQLKLPKGGVPADWRWDENRYVRTKNRWNAFGLLRGEKVEGLTWAEWQKAGLDGKSTYAEEKSAGQRVIVRPNEYEAGRATIAIYNGEEKPHVDVDVAKILEKGDRFELRNAEDFFGEPVLQGVYDRNSLRVEMKTRAVAQAVGAGRKLEGSGPQFGVFILRRVAK